MGVPLMTKTGQEAWNVLESARNRAKKEGMEVSDHIALVLTDLEMPEMDGFTLTRRIKSDASLQHIPVGDSLVAVGRGERTACAQGRRECVYVSKFEPVELAAVMRTALGRAA